MIQILIPSYNCYEWISRCMASVASQDYDDYQVLVIDDASTDVRQPAAIQRFCEAMGWNYWLRSKNIKCPANLYYGIERMKPAPDDVIFLLDGDDFLPHDQVFTRIAEVYEDPEVWLTYGNYEPFPENTGQTPASAYPVQVIEQNHYRYEPSLFNHPLTFRAHLWDRIPMSELQEHGRFFTIAYDRAIMIPMLELSGPEHFRFLNEALYMYNAVNPNSDYHRAVDEAQRVHGVINKRKKLRR